jgi:predicted double-glycine peptidase
MRLRWITPPAAVLLTVLMPLVSHATMLELYIGPMGEGVTVEHEVEDSYQLRQKNVVIQQRDYSCGTASLATLLNYYLDTPVKEVDIIKTLLELNKKRGTLEQVIQRKGFSMLDLKLYAENKGFKAVGFRLDFDELANLGFPALVPIIPDGFKHFVVFKGSDEKRVFLADPSFGNLIESIDQFKADWYGFTNVAMVVLRPGEEKMLGKKHTILSDLDKVYAGQDDINDILLTRIPERIQIPGEF